MEFLFYIMRFAMIVLAVLLICYLYLLPWNEKRLAELKILCSPTGDVTCIKGIVRRFTKLINGRDINVLGFYYLDREKGNLSSDFLGEVSLYVPSAPMLAFYNLEPRDLKKSCEIDTRIMEKLGPDTWFVPFSMNRTAQSWKSRQCKDYNAAPADKKFCWFLTNKSYIDIIKKCMSCPAFLPVGVFAVKGNRIDIDGVQQLLGELGGKVRSAVMYHKVATSVTRDSLTSLFNRQGYEEYLERQFAIAACYNQPLSVCLLAIDAFRKFCAAYGEDAGDGLLLEVASLIKSSVRKSDIVARYEEEMFCIIFPLTSKDEASKIAEATRHTISGYLFYGDKRATVSAGIAGYPDDGIETADNLHDKASTALLKAKVVEAGVKA